MTHIPARAERQLSKLVRAYGTANVIGETHEIAGKRRMNPKDSSTAWGVFPHAEQRVVTGRGYVVRQTQSGHAVDQYNYGGVTPVAVFSHRAKAAAEKFAAKQRDFPINLTPSKAEMKEVVRRLTRGRSENPKARKTARRTRLLKEIAFFKRHAGGQVGHASEGALELARAEKYADDHGWKVVWATDDDADWSWLDQPGFEREKAKDHEVYRAYLQDKDANVLASLSGIFDPDQNYTRVVEAELALEATSRHQRRGRNPVKGHKAMLVRASKHLTTLVRAGRKVRDTAISVHRTLTVTRRGGTVRRKKNPVMGILGNPPYGDQPSSVLGTVTYIEYTHGFDKQPYKHTFRPAAIAVLSQDGKSLKILRKDGKPLWKLYEV